MTRQTIRKSVWETNSSSAHSLVIPRNTYFEQVHLHHIDDEKRRKYLEAQKQKYRDEIAKRNGVIKVELGAYGWSYDELFGFEEKLSYICTDILDCKLNEKVTEEDMLVELDAVGLLDLLQKELGITQIKLQNIHDYCYIDHESIGTVCSTLKCDYAQNVIIDFLVDDNIMVLITNDNEPTYGLDEFVHINNYNKMSKLEGVTTKENAPDWMKD